MTVPTTPPVCPHCGAPMRRFTLPDASGWQGAYHWACFNDECSYFRRGWVWMFDTYGVKASYRYRIDPATGAASPLAVWSRDAIKDRIIEDDAALPTPAATPQARSGERSVIREKARRRKGRQ
ncbi:MAG: ogr/Delta-like zinc finger family protein [Thermoanaerobaculaceae bacterium]|nr:ogr/Delta-like zinc finger family protein [Thermoanaerobaculaceae bacterium]